MANLDYPEGSGPLCSRQAKKKWIIGGSIGVVALIIVIVIIVETTKGGKELPKNGSWVLLNVPLIDGHNELAWKLKKYYSNDITKYDFRKNLINNTANMKIQTDYPRLNKGRVGTVVWVVSAPCESQYRDAVALTLEQIDVMKRFFRNYTDLLEPFTMSPDIWTSFSNKKKGSILGLSGGHSIDSRLSVLRMYYQLGVRYMSLANECSTPWVGGNILDYNNSTEKIVLTDWGKEVIREMNRLGMMIDLSGTSHEAMLEVLKVAKTPVILSSTAAFGIKSHVKNVQDDVLEKLKTNKGLVMLSFDADLLSNDPKVCNVNNIIEHIEYIVDKTSIDNVGIGANFERMKKQCDEVDDVSKYYKIFDGLYEKNSTRWSFANLEKLATRNFERVFIAAETYKIKHINDLPNIDSIPRKELEKAYSAETMKCRLELLPKPSL